jgi:hypothetical protein
MTELPDDQLQQYYTEKLWELIPPLYRDEDGDDGPLRALMEVLSEQAAIVRRSTDRLWSDEFIDLCDSWAVPYLGDLVGTRMVSSLNQWGRRADVANTIYYRRRAGTLAVLEGLIADITGWEGAVVEEFRDLLRYAHGLDSRPAATGGLTQTPAHGLPDLRQPRGGRLAWGAWDEFAHLPDTRRHHGGLDGRYGIIKLAFHLYRLGSFAVLRATPRVLAADADGRSRFSFDPAGRAVPLFQEHSRPNFAQGWRAAREWELPGPMRCEVLGHAEYLITEASILAWAAAGEVTSAQADQLRRVRGQRFTSESSLRIRLADLLGPGFAGVAQILAGALVEDCGKAALLPTGTGQPGDVWSVMVETTKAGSLTPVPQEQIAAGNLTAGVVSPDEKQLVIDAENGLGHFTAAAPPATFTVSYSYGFTGPVGAGSFARPGLASVAAADERRGGGPLAAPSAAADAALGIMDSATYRPVPDMTVRDSLLLQAASEQRPYLDLTQDQTITAAQPGSDLIIDGWWLGSREPRTVTLAAAANASWGTVRIVHSTLDPGGADADGVPLGPVSLVIASTVSELIIDACVLGPVIVTPAGFAGQITVTSSILHTTDPAAPVALRQPDGELTMRGCTVIGQLEARQLDASELLCTGKITLENLQAGCVRFSAYPPDSDVPRAYRSAAVTDPHSLFVSLVFGDPGYAQLSGTAPAAIARGGDDGTEIGAFHRLLTPVKLDSLQAKVGEFLPFGLIPIFITET